MRRHPDLPRIHSTSGVRQGESHAPRKINTALPSADKSQVQALDAWKCGERLVGIGFRCWLEGYETRQFDETHDIDCWEMG